MAPCVGETLGCYGYSTSGTSISVKDFRTVTHSHQLWSAFYIVLRLWYGALPWGIGNLISDDAVSTAVSDMKESFLLKPLELAPDGRLPDFFLFTMY
jgi:hypothetical protein